MPNFLDAHPQNWADPAYAELRDLLVTSAGQNGLNFLSELADLAGITFGTFPEGFDNVRTAARSLIKVMGDQGKLRAMVSEAAQSQLISGNARQQFQAMLDRPAFVSPAHRRRVDQHEPQPTVPSWWPDRANK